MATIPGLEAERDALRVGLRGLLARAHRDGGQRQRRTLDAELLRAADSAILRLLQEIDRLRSELDAERRRKAGLPGGSRG